MDNKNLQYTLSLKDLFTGKMAKAVDQTKRMDNTVAGLGSKLKNLAIGFGVAGLAKGIVDSTAKMESLNNVINYTSINAADAAKNHEFLNKIISDMKLPVVETTEGFSKLSGAMLGTKLQGEETRKIFEGVATAATAFHLTAEDTNGVFLALSQMMSKGKVSAEELRGQLGERMPGAFRLAAEAMGVTQAQLGEMMKDGQVISEEFLPKFAAKLKDTFGGALPAATKSLQANLTEMNNKWVELKTTLGESLMPVIKGLLTFLTKLLSIIKQFLPLIKMAVTLWGAYYIKLKLASLQSFNFALAQRAMAMGMSKSAVAAGFLSRGIRTIGHAIKAVPIIGWIALIIEGIMYLWDTFEGFRTSVYRAFETFINMGKFLAGLFTGLGNIIKGTLNGMPETVRLGQQQIKAGALSTHLATEAGVKKRVSAYNAENGLGGNASASEVGGSGGSVSGGAGGSGSLGTGTDVSSARPQSLIINISDGLVKQMNIYTTNLKEGSAKIREEVAKALLEVANDANLAAR